MDKKTKTKDKMRKTSMYSHKLTKGSVLPTISARFPVPGGIYENGPRNIALQESFWSFRASLFPCHTKSSARAQMQSCFVVHMHEVTPSAVAMADSTLMAV
jgi:hypothetical protein